MRPSEWRRALLERHQLEKPDGRPLYRYRITDSEYNTLKQIVEETSAQGMNYARGKLLYWDSLFVFYGSEWWRRHYEGRWGWEGIFQSIGFTEDISIAQRNAIVEIGLARWNRDVRIRNEQRQLLGTVATEGGLPLNQLATGSGWLKRILTAVIKRHIATQLPIYDLLEAYIDNIPRNYRSVEMRQVLEDIAVSVVSLRDHLHRHP